MTPTKCEHPALPGQITFLCQQCHGDLERTGQTYAGEPVWACQHCFRAWIYTLAGWGCITIWDATKPPDAAHA